MVGHYWLCTPQLAPNDALRQDLRETNARIQKFASDVQVGQVAAPSGRQFEPVLIIGIGGSAIDADPEEVYHVLRHLAARLDID